MSLDYPLPPSCGYEGYAGEGADGTPIRLFSKKDCEAKGGVTDSKTGECVYANRQGSFSWDCRAVNNVPLLAMLYNNPVGALYDNRYIVGGAAVVIAGLAVYRYQMMRRG